MGVCAQVHACVAGGMSHARMSRRVGWGAVRSILTAERFALDKELGHRRPGPSTLGELGGVLLVHRDVLDVDLKKKETPIGHKIKIGSKIGLQAPISNGQVIGKGARRWQG